MSWSYEDQKKLVAANNRERSLKGRDIGEIPPVENKARRERCRKNLRLFFETYYPAVFYRGWSEAHLKAIAKIQAAILKGGLFGVALPRSFGKTAKLVAAAEWALLYGHRSFVVLIGATETAATEMLDTITADLELNDGLLADFPEVCYPIRKLEAIPQRANGQLCEGLPTNIGWTQKELVLPTVKGSLASGSRVKVAGITGRIRGMSASRSVEATTGKRSGKRTSQKIRPDLALVDDPQTDESARSPRQVADRMAILNGAILGLSGPGKKISAFAAVTVIQRGDVATQLLDQKINPEWQGERASLLKSLPTNNDLWEKYAELRANGFRAGIGLTDATAFYVANRAAMDAGGEATWDSQYEPDEASAIQHGMNLKLRDEASFAAEYQNQPLSVDTASALALTPECIAGKAVETARGVVPTNSTKLTSFIDVQGKVLFYVVVAWDEHFAGHVVEYGSYPEQPRSYWTLRDVAPTLNDVKPGATFEGYLYAGLTALTDRLIATQWVIDGAAKPISLSRILIDANWGDSTAVVKQFARESAHKSIIIPSHGRGITADRKPLNEYSIEDGVRRGWNWQHKVKDGHIIYDTNSWKSFVAGRILLAPGEIGTLSLHKGTGVTHRMFIDHLCAEYAVQVSAMGRTVNQWSALPNTENHWLDCLIGAAVAASEQGIRAVGHGTAAKQMQRVRRKYSATF